MPAPISQESDTMQTPATDTLDLDVLKAAVGDEPDVLADFLVDFRQVAASTLEMLHSALHAGDARSIANLAHRLKSSAGAVGAKALGELSARLESAGERAEPGAHLGTLIEQMERELHNLACRIDHLRA